MIQFLGETKTDKIAHPSNDGSFDIDEVPPGAYVIVVNKDGKMTSSEPFGAFYFPKVRKREEASVFNIDIGDIVENLEIYPPMEVKTITVEGLLLYSDGKPVADVPVSFKAVRKPSTQKDEDEDDTNDARTSTDLKGRFSIKIVQGVNGFLSGGSYFYIGEFENCPKLDRLIKAGGSTSSRIETSPIEIKATANLYGIELKFPFPSCKKAKE